MSHRALACLAFSHRLHRIAWALYAVMAAFVVVYLMTAGADMLKEVFQDENPTAGGTAEAATSARGISQVADRVDELARPLLWVSIGFAPLVGGVGGLMLGTGNRQGINLIYAAVAGPLVILLTRGFAA